MFTGIRSKLYASFASVALLAVAAGLTGVFYVSSLGALGSEATVKLLPVGHAMMEAELALSESRIASFGGDAAKARETAAEALWYCNAVLSGGKSDMGEFVPTGDAKLRSMIGDALASLTDFDRALGQGASAGELSGKYEKSMELLETTELYANDKAHAALVSFHESIPRARTILWATLCASLGAAALLSWQLASRMTSELLKSIGFAKSLSGGDLASRIEAKGSDEIAELASSLDSLGQNLRSNISGVTFGVSSVGSASSTLAGISEELKTEASRSRGMTDSLSANARELAANARDVETAMRDAAQAAGGVAEAGRSMGESIRHIAGMADRTKAASGTARGEVESLVTRVTELGRASSEIGKVSGAIKDISEQTKLLALNATIEAARAGEAGKGFAVVANEIKELARQTALATQDIGNRVEAVKSSTQHTVAGIERISGAMSEVDASIVEIASTVTQQAAAMSATTGRLDLIVTAVGEAERRMVVSSEAARRVADEAAELEGDAGKVEQMAASVGECAATLTSLASRLNESTKGYRL